MQRERLRGHVEGQARRAGSALDRDDGQAAAVDRDESPIATSSSGSTPGPRPASRPRGPSTTLSMRPTACTMPVNIRRFGDPRSRHATTRAQDPRHGSHVADAIDRLERERNARLEAARDVETGRCRAPDRRAGSARRRARISSTRPASSSAPLSSRARLDVDLVELALRELAHHRVQVDATVARPEARRGSTSSGHASLRGAGRDDAAHRPCSTLRFARRLARADRRRCAAAGGASRRRAR